jgi:hypothetical protein
MPPNTSIRMLAKREPSAPSPATKVPYKARRDPAAGASFAGFAGAPSFAVFAKGGCAASNPVTSVPRKAQQGIALGTGFAGSAGAPPFAVFAKGGSSVSNPATSVPRKAQRGTSAGAGLAPEPTRSRAGASNSIGSPARSPVAAACSKWRIDTPRSPVEALCPSTQTGKNKRLKKRHSRGKRHSP